MKNVLFAALFLVALTAIASEPLPKDVRDFVSKREGCDHFRGEIGDSSDRRRANEVNRQLKKLCTGTDRKLAQFKKKYSANPAASQRLNEFEPGIEASSF